MGKLPIIILGAVGVVAASPAAAQDNRRPRVNCTEPNPCSERRGGYLWFYLGQDEGQRPIRRVVRRFSLDD